MTKSFVVFLILSDATSRNTRQMCLKFKHVCIYIERESLPRLVMLNMHLSYPRSTTLWFNLEALLDGLCGMNVKLKQNLNVLEIYRDASLAKLPHQKKIVWHLILEQHKQKFSQTSTWWDLHTKWLRYKVEAKPNQKSKEDSLSASQSFNPKWSPNLSNSQVLKYKIVMRRRKNWFCMPLNFILCSLESVG